MAQPEARWLLQQDRPGADLLISEPLCCNLLGELAADLELAGGVRPGRPTALAALRACFRPSAGFVIRSCWWA